jgi:hypothetical protein
MRRGDAHAGHLARLVLQRQPQNLTRLPPHHGGDREHAWNTGVLVAGDDKVSLAQGFNRDRTLRCQNLGALNSKLQRQKMK